MSGRLVQLIAMREITARLRDRVFWVSTAFLIVVVAGSVIIPALFLSDDDRPEITLAVTGGAAEQALGQGAAAIAEAAPEDSPAGATITLRPVTDPAAAETAVADGTVDAALVGTTGGDVEVVAEREVPSELTQALAVAAHELALRDGLTAAGAPEAEATRLLVDAAGSAPEQRLLDPPSDDEEAAVGLSMLFALLFFFTTFMFGMSIAQSVVEEKQGRVVELLVAAVPVRTLLTGKVLGNLALALGQIVALLAAGTVGAALAGQTEIVELLGASSGWFVVFFVLGFGMFSCLWAAAGALATRQEDLQSTTVPLQALMFVPFFGAIYVQTPGTALTVLSYIPFTAPIAMPRRLLLDDAALWEPFVAAGIMLATAAVFVLVAARLYERSLLRTHARTSWREAWTTPSR